MKVSITPLNYNIHGAATSAAAGVKTPLKDAQPTPATSVSIQLSAASSAPLNADIDLERVNAITQAIQRGELTIDTSRIASELINSAIDLLSARTRT